MPVPAGGQVFLKREDEAGYAISGGKLRKFAGLIPYWKATGIKRILVIGGSQSNQVLAAAQILRHEGLEFRLVVKKSHHYGPGNAFLTEMLVPRSEWIELGQDEWQRVEVFATQYAAQTEVPTFVLPEGGWCSQALSGTFSLARDLTRDEANELIPRPDHIFIEAGTALSAIGLLLALPFYANSPSLPTVHILLMAMNEDEFNRRLVEASEWAAEKWPQYFPTHLPPIELHIPRNARSFGSVNRTLFQDMVRTARTYGVLTDTVYSGKLFFESERIIQEKELTGNIVLVHSGGQSSLPGFYEKIKGLL